MRIDGPKGIGSWLQGFFSGSFKGRLVGETEVEGPIVASSSHLLVHGNIYVSGTVARGTDVTASGKNSYAGGTGLIATGEDQTVIGRYNKVNPNSLFIIGSGSSDTDRKNVAWLTKNGELHVRKLISDVSPIYDTGSFNEISAVEVSASYQVVSPSGTFEYVSASSQLIANSITASHISASSTVTAGSFYTAGDVTASLVSASNVSASTIQVNGNVTIGEGAVQTIISNGEMKVGKIIVREFITSSTPEQAIDRVELSYRSGSESSSGELLFNFLNS